MILTAKQEQGLQLAVQRYKTNEPYTCIGGFAGSGKSTLVRFIIDALQVPPHQVCYVAYTGKAAQVLRRKGCANAMTAHRLLYKSIPLENGRFKHIPRTSIEPFKVIVVDEVSMLPKRMWETLLAHGKYVIALGDPGQLPPVAGDNNEVLEHPHIFLDEIMRQAQENEIIRLTMHIREGKPLELFSGKDVRVVPRSEILKDGFLFWGDQILCAKNITRRQFNSTIRKISLNVNDNLPIVGDKVICLRNDWDFVNLSGDALVNGLSGTVKKITYLDPRHPLFNPFMEKTPLIDVMPDYDDTSIFEDIDIDYKLFSDGEPSINWKNWKQIPKPYHPHEFDYGYVITVHKAQGSEWDKVIVFEEYMKDQTRDDFKRWLYTAATRAAKKLIVVRTI